MYGCYGGQPGRAYLYIKDNHGIDSEEAYPYKGKNGNCTFNHTSIAATDEGFISLQPGDEEQLKIAVATIGPISASIDSTDLWPYTKGIYYNPTCSTTKLDHSILIVGYGKESGKPFWIIKNSWGAHWGENGYFRLIRNAKNHCGIATEAIYPIV